MQTAAIKLLLSRVRVRMSEERLTQRALAAHLGVSQGHLSKVLRGMQMHQTRVMRALGAWVGESASSLPSGDKLDLALSRAAREAGAGSEEAGRLVLRVLRAMRRLRSAR